ncbi:MAG: hypothetical protein ABSB32_10680, partial [Thermodesulfobacteriota bacterium]
TPSFDPWEVCASLISSSTITTPLDDRCGELRIRTAHYTPQLYVSTKIEFQTLKLAQDDMSF